MAQTPWGELPVSDAHVHFFSYAFYSELARQRKLADATALAPLLNWEIPPADPVELGQRWIAEIKRYGIQRACLIASIPGDEGSVAQTVSRFPERFFGYFMLNPKQADAMDRMKAACGNPGLHGVCLFPAMHGFALSDNRSIAILEIASQHEMAVFVHCGALSVGVRNKLGLPSPFDMRFSNPLDLHPVALQFPKIRFVIPHFGAGLFREALMVADLCLNVYLDTSSSNHWMLYEGLNLRTVFRRTLDVVGPERLLFGTDSSFFPRGWNAAVFEQQATALYELGLDQAQAAQIFSRNLERMLSARAQA